MATEAQSSTVRHLAQVVHERGRREREPLLAAAVLSTKQCQQRCFKLTYEDLFRSARYGPASRFFIEELYGPRDFSLRDAQFARALPGFVRLLPEELGSQPVRMTKACRLYWHGYLECEANLSIFAPETAPPKKKAPIGSRWGLFR